jgi:hypothetical protein
MTDPRLYEFSMVAGEFVDVYSKQEGKCFFVGLLLTQYAISCLGLPGDVLFHRHGPQRSGVHRVDLKNLEARWIVGQHRSTVVALLGADQRSVSRVDLGRTRGHYPQIRVRIPEERVPQSDLHPALGVYA